MKVVVHPIGSDRVQILIGGALVGAFPTVDADLVEKVARAVQDACAAACDERADGHRTTIRAGAGDARELSYRVSESQKCARTVRAL